MLSYRIKKARKDIGWNQTQLAEVLGKSRTAVVNWETGYSKPEDTTIDLISKYLGVHKEWLLDTSNDEFEQVELKVIEIHEEKELTVKEVIGLRLRLYRKRKGLTLEEVSKKVDFALQTIRGYETGGREPNFETLIKLADIYEMSIDNLLGISNKIDSMDVASEMWMLEVISSDKPKIEAMKKIWGVINEI